MAVVVAGRVDEKHLQPLRAAAVEQCAGRFFHSRDRSVIKVAIDRAIKKIAGGRER
jgi:hypothetical protein